MKIIDKNFIKESHKEDFSKIENDLLIKINCPFLADIKFVIQDKNNLYILTDFSSGGELLFHLHKERRFSNEKAKFYLIEIILAIEYLHKNNILYQDLKPENILIDNNGHIKLIDFGLNKILKKQKEKSYTICENPQYLAPEILSDNEYDSTVDWWSLGCIFYEILIGRAPYKISLGDYFNEDLYKKRILIPEYVTDEAEDLINGLLVANPKNRLGFGEDGTTKIKYHPYFKDINWDDGWNRKIIPPFIPNFDNETYLKYYDITLNDGKIINGDSSFSGLVINNKNMKGSNNISNFEGNELMNMNDSNDEIITN